MQKRFLFIAFLFLTSLLVSNIVASKLVYLWGMILPAAVFVFPITFLATDTINEVWGKDRAKEVIWLGFLMNLVMVLFLQLARILPPAPVWEQQQAFDAILGMVPRIVVASLGAYLVSQLHDVWAFNFWKKVTSGKHLWLRNCFSTATSQLMDSAVFISVAFGGTVALPALVTMIFSQYLVKLLFVLIDTPFCYLTVSWAKKEVKVCGGEIQQ